jgi:hypothetical protein
MIFGFISPIVLQDIRQAKDTRMKVLMNLFIANCEAKKENGQIRVSNNVTAISLNSWAMEIEVSNSSLVKKIAFSGYLICTLKPFNKIA